MVSSEIPRIPRVHQFRMMDSLGRIDLQDIEGASHAQE